MTKPRTALAAVFACCAGALASAEPLRVVTSIPDFAVIAKAIGGADVDAESIVKGNRDVHAVELLPSLVLKVRKANVYVKVGLELDLWAQQLIDGSRNASLVVVDASSRIAPLEVPAFKVDASHGDLHEYGNPHYWLDPANAARVADAILDGLTRVAPEKTGAFRASADAYAARMAEATKTWQERLAPLSGTAVVSFHDSWPYFAARFGIRVVDFLEPKPGVPPTPAHIAALQRLLAKGEVKAIIMESYFDDRVPVMLSKATGVPLVKVPVLVSAAPGVDDQFALFDTITKALTEAIGGR